ncbi:MAG: hypothetical protein A2915_02950 [Candidatus Yanofskybacteria bacterium RIFCSPLOWO2_01_FULL_41_34]|uniref:Uncharacterized protein n=1 Tax=Candidatus Yanofskybacteria bacterium RIFCSPHIGHO2_01_FULL_41_26 TaxID=1802661 RepID=A0A1F8EE63_9BACT|nr:MAG: hypothetical protein A2649_00845 [Candidatus Yanofskybacteria bacterium RIFCSPHIGHO2_01_FULL_41_26]OGN20994.1 MAG: hypothetical protein A2915_02950 [Candidatus Yanofskybacteria bacterium RIFCSPLOWO2_01_FULL_41_34]
MKLDNKNSNSPRVNRPDVTRIVEALLIEPETNKQTKAAYALMEMAFEAGRKFQKENSKTGLNNPNVYVF